MKLASIEFETPYILDKNINYLVVENKNKFYDYCKTLLNQGNGENGHFILSQNNQELSFHNHAYVINNPINLSFSDKKVTNKLHQITSSLVNSNFIEEFNELTVNIVDFMQSVSIDHDFEVEYNDNPDVSAILKAVDYKLVNASETLLGSLVNFLNVITSFFKPKLIIIYNLRVWLSDADCLEFYKYVKYNEIKILILESRSYDKLDDENYFIIDGDLCELTF